MSPPRELFSGFYDSDKCILRIVFSGLFKKITYSHNFLAIYTKKFICTLCLFLIIVDENLNLVKIISKVLDKVSDPERF